MDLPPILLVEDDKDDVELTLCAFREANIANPIVVASDGVEAIDYLFGSGRHAGRDLAVQPVMVLLDLRLPRLDGLEVLVMVRAQAMTKALPVVVMTASSDPRDRVAATDLHIDAYVEKPVDFHRFLRVARQLGLYWTVDSAPAPA